MMICMDCGHVGEPVTFDFNGHWLTGCGHCEGSMRYMTAYEEADELLYEEEEDIWYA